MNFKHDEVLTLNHTFRAFSDGSGSTVCRLIQDWLKMNAEISQLKAELDSLQTTVSASHSLKKPSTCQAEHFKFGKCTKRHGHTNVHNSSTGVWMVDDGTYCLSMPIAEWLGLLAEAVPDRPQSHRDQQCKSTWNGLKCSLRIGHREYHSYGQVDA